MSAKNEFWVAGRWSEDGSFSMDAGLSSACITIPCFNVFTSKQACERHIRLSKSKELQPVQIAKFQFFQPDDRQPDNGDILGQDLIDAIPEYEEWGDTW